MEYYLIAFLDGLPSCLASPNYIYIVINTGLTRHPETDVNR